MRNFCVIWVFFLLGLGFFCQGFMVAPRTGRRPSRLQCDELKERVLILENDMKYIEKSYDFLKEDNQRLSAKMDGVYEQVIAKIEKVSAENKAENKAQFDKIEAQFDKMATENKAQFDKMATVNKAQFDKMATETKAQFDKMVTENKAQADETKAQFDKMATENKAQADETKAQFDKLAEKFDKVAAEIKDENKAQYEKLSTRIDDVSSMFIPIYLVITFFAATEMGNAKNFVNFFK